MATRLLIILFSLFLLSGCATVSPNQLGISQSQWNQYSDEQRQQIINNYHKSQSVKRELHAKSGHSVLAVRVQDGLVLMPPYTSMQPYQPVAFNIKEGSCNQKIALVQANSSGQKTDMKACYT